MYFLLVILNGMKNLFLFRISDPSQDQDDTGNLFNDFCFSSLVDSGFYFINCFNITHLIRYNSLELA